MNDKQDEGEWAVFDMNARNVTENGDTKPRVHQSRLGKSWKLYFDKPCYMPEAEARVFLKDPSFRVLNHAGEEVPCLQAAQISRKLPDRLPPDMVVANVAELTMDALLTRAAQRAGGNKFTATSARTAIIDFLIDGVKSDERGALRRLNNDGAAAGGPAEATGMDVDDMDDEMARKMLEGV